MHNPLFSISMPNYNKGKYIPDAIQSVLDQTYENWQLIIVDDGSTDKSLKRIQKFNDPRIESIFLSKNHGCSYCHYHAFAMARGELIGMLDSDDMLVPEALQKMVILAELNPNAGFLYSNYLHCDDKMKPIRAGNNHYPIEGGSIMYDRNAVSHFKVIRKNAYGKSLKFDPTLPRAVDRDITLKMEEVTGFAFVDDPLYLYRYTDAGISTRIAGNADAAKECFERAIRAAKKRRGMGLNTQNCRALIR